MPIKCLSISSKHSSGFAIHKEIGAFDKAVQMCELSTPPQNPNIVGPLLYNRRRGPPTNKLLMVNPI